MGGGDSEAGPDLTPEILAQEGELKNLRAISDAQQKNASEEAIQNMRDQMTSLAGTLGGASPGDTSNPASQSVPAGKKVPTPSTGLL